MEATVSSVGWGWRSQPSRRSISHLWGSSTILERSLHVRLWETVIALHGLIDSVDSVCALIFDRPASSANHSLWHSKMKYSCCRFLNIQTCARCRPNFTDLCLRVTESPDEIFTALPRVPQMPKLCPRFYDRGLNLDKSFTSFGTSCKRWNWKTLRRVKSHQKSPESKWNSRLSVWQFKPLPISVRFYDICEHLWNICEQKGDFGD